MGHLIAHYKKCTCKIWEINKNDHMNTCKDIVAKREIARYFFQRFFLLLERRKDIERWQIVRRNFSSQTLYLFCHNIFKSSVRLVEVLKSRLQVKNGENIVKCLFYCTTWLLASQLLPLIDPPLKLATSIA